MNVEIVAPGGSYTKAMVAANNWADAVYLWVPFTSLRMRQNKLNTFDSLKETVAQIHQMWKKVYLTMNIFPRNSDIKLFESVVEKISDVWADAIIFSDLWTYNIIKKYIKNIDLHLSTQTSTLNYEAVKFWYDLWIKRVVLARELNIKEIAQIKKEVPDMELEIFAHGAMCVSYSGRCLLGEYFSGRDGNKWECSHVCRYWYKVYLEEEKRPWKLFQLNQNDGISYLMSSKDLCTIERLSEVVPYIDGLKIEWRSKWEFYVWATVKAYREAVDSIVSGKKLDENIKNLVYQIPHRPYWEWFLLNDRKKYRPDSEYWEKEITNDPSSISYDTPGPVKERVYYWLLLPEKKEINGLTFIKIVPKDNIKVGDEFDFLSSKWFWKTKIKDIFYKSSWVDRAHCNMENVFVNFDKNFEGWEILYK